MSSVLIVDASLHLITCRVEFPSGYHRRLCRIGWLDGTCIVSKKYQVLHGECVIYTQTTDGPFHAPYHSHVILVLDSG